MPRRRKNPSPRGSSIDRIELPPSLARHPRLFLAAVAFVAALAEATAEDAGSGASAEPRRRGGRDTPRHRVRHRRPGEEDDEEDDDE